MADQEEGADMACLYKTLAANRKRRARIGAV
jgi:hypothetical protein